MSKNFELMQLDYESAIPPKVSLRSNNGDGAGHGNGARLDLAFLAREESLKLVQRVFLSRSESDVHWNRRHTRAQCLGLGVPDRCEHACTFAAALFKCHQSSGTNTGLA